jgi:hypothetical protein
MTPVWLIPSQESEVLSIIRYRGTSKIAEQLFLIALRSSRCPYTLLLIELPTPVIPFTFRALLCPSVLIVPSWSILIISLPCPEFAFYRLSVGFLFFGNHIPCTLYVTSSCVKLFFVANLRYLHALLYTWQIKTSMWSKFSPFINFTQLSDKHIPNHQVWNL